MGGLKGEGGKYVFRSNLLPFSEPDQMTPGLLSKKNEQRIVLCKLSRVAVLNKC